MWERERGRDLKWRIFGIASLSKPTFHVESLFKIHCSCILEKGVFLLYIQGFQMYFLRSWKVDLNTPNVMIVSLYIDYCFNCNYFFSRHCIVIWYGWPYFLWISLSVNIMKKICFFLNLNFIKICRFNFIYIIFLTISFIIHSTECKWGNLYSQCDHDSRGVCKLHSFIIIIIWSVFYYFLNNWLCVILIKSLLT